MIEPAVRVSDYYTTDQLLHQDFAQNLPNSASEDSNQHVYLVVKFGCCDNQKLPSAHNGENDHE